MATTHAERAGPPAESFPPRLANGRFELRRKLGEGGMGTVYEAHDHETRSRVALKTLKTFSGGDVYRLKHEFRALSDLDHPNLVRLGELHCDGERWFFTMELVDGENLLSHLRAACLEDSPSARRALGAGLATHEVAAVLSADAERAGELQEHRLRPALLQLARALSALHDAGCIHYDIKPSNILVDRAGRLVLLDFGISAPLGSRSPLDSKVEGTLAYMAPEQAHGAPASPEADWYGFGALLFEALTARLPFAGAAEHVLAAKRLGPPRVVTPQPVPEDLLALSLALLRPDPAERPRREEILACLGDRQEPRRSAAGPGFVGRQTELATLCDWLGEAGSWCGLILGEAGIGKTALLHAALADQPDAPRRALLLRGRCYEQESLPYKAWDGLLDALSEALLQGSLNVAELGGLSAPELQALALVFPVLRRVESFDAHARTAALAPWTHDDVEHRARSAVVRLLGTLAERRPVLLAVDDLHWADEASLTLFAELLSAEPSPAVRLLATSRTLHPLLAPQLRERWRSIELGPLPAPDARALAEQVLERTSLAEAPALCAEAGGHPLHLLELCRHARKADRSGGPLRLIDALAARIRLLPERAKRLVELVTLAAAPVPLASLALAADIDGAECQRLVHALSTQHILRACKLRRQRAVEAYHDRVRDACLEQLGEARTLRDVAELHWGLAHALHSSLAAAERELELPRIARGLLAGLPARADAASRALAFDVSLAVARQLRRAGAFAAAVLHCERAAALLPGDAFAHDYARAFAVERELMELHGHLGDEAASRACYRALLGGARDGLDRASVHDARAWLEVRTTAYTDAIATIRSGLAELDAALPEAPHPAHLLGKLGLILLRHRPLSEARVLSLPRCTDERSRREMALLLALPPPAFTQGRNTLGALAMLQLAQLSLERGITPHSALGLAGLGMVLSGSFGATRTAMQCASAAQALAAHFGDPFISSYVAFFCGGFIYPWARPLDECRAQLEHALAHAAAAGDRIHIDFIAANIALNVLLAGHSLRDVARIEELVALLRPGKPQLIACLDCLRRPWYFLQDQDGARDAAEFDAHADATLAGEFPGAPAAVLYGHYVAKGIALTLAHAPELACAAFARAAPLRRAGFALSLVAEHALYDALAHCMTAGRSPARRVAAAHKTLRALAALHKRARECPATFASRRSLLLAEQARLLGRHAEAAQHYRACEEHARAHGSHVLAALAAERAARDVAEQRGTAAAAPLLEHAALAWRGVEGRRIERQLRAAFG